MLNNTAVDDLTKTFAMVPCSQADLIWPDGTSTFDKKNQQHIWNVKFLHKINLRSAEHNKRILANMDYSGGPHSSACSPPHLRQRKCKGNNFKS